MGMVMERWCPTQQMLGVLLKGCCVVKKLLLTTAMFSVLSAPTYATNIAPDFAKRPNQEYVCRNQEMVHNADYTRAGYVMGNLSMSISIHPAEGKVFWKDNDGKSYWGQVTDAFTDPHRTWAVPAPGGSRTVTIIDPTYLSVVWVGGSFYMGNEPGKEKIQTHLQPTYYSGTTKKPTASYIYCWDGKTNSTGIDFEHAIHIVPKPPSPPTPPTKSNCLFYMYAYKPSMQYGGSMQYDINADRYCSSLYGN
jgi:hypothetical protein